MKIFALVIAVLTLQPGVESGSRPESGLDDLSRMTGCWTGEGVLSGRAADFHLAFRDNGPLLSLNYMVESDGGGDFRAVAIYRESPGLGTWYDSAGNTYDLTYGAPVDGVMTVNWGVGPEVRGRTHYRLEGGSLQVEDQVLSEAGWFTFARAQYVRSSCVDSA